MTGKKIERNPALNTSFKLELPEMPQLNYFIQMTNLPGMSMGGVDAPYRNYQTNVPSNRIEYDTLTLTFIVDEQFLNFDEIRLWMHKIEKAPELKDMMKDVTLHVLGSNKNGILGVKFKGAYPTMLSEVPFESSTSDAQPTLCTMTLRYQYYDFVRA